LALFDRLKYDPVNDSELVWKYPSDQITLGSQLLVNTSQEAIFRKNGKNVDIFEPGNHTLSTSNLPVLSTIINLPFGGQTPFSAEVWFVNKTPKRDLKWGTSSPIPLIDPKYNMPVNIRAFGQWGIEITDAILFVDQMVGAKSLAESDQIYEYFRGELIQDVSEIISQDIASGVASIFNINAALSSISKRVSEIFNARLRKYGINLTNFSLDRINLPQEEMQKIQEIMLKRMEVEQLGSVNVTNEYATVKTFDILNNFFSFKKNNFEILAKLKLDKINPRNKNLYNIGGFVNFAKDRVSATIHYDNSSRIAPYNIMLFKNYKIEFNLYGEYKIFSVNQKFWKEKITRYSYPLLVKKGKFYKINLIDKLIGTFIKSNVMTKDINKGINCFEVILASMISSKINSPLSFNNMSESIRKYKFFNKNILIT
jgi:membrane protease subunit (stomatin/prohibitin family)